MIQAAAWTAAASSSPARSSRTGALRRRSRGRRPRRPSTASRGARCGPRRGAGRRDAHLERAADPRRGRRSGVAAPEDHGPARSARIGRRRSTASPAGASTGWTCGSSSSSSSATLGAPDVPPRRAVPDALRRGLPRPDGDGVPPGLALRHLPRHLRVDPPAPREVRDGRRPRRVGATTGSARRATSACRSATRSSSRAATIPRLTGGRGGDRVHVVDRQRAPLVRPARPEPRLHGRRSRVRRASPTTTSATGSSSAPTTADPRVRRERPRRRHEPGARGARRPALGVRPRRRWDRPALREQRRPDAPRRDEGRPARHARRRLGRDDRRRQARRDQGFAPGGTGPVVATQAGAVEDPAAAAAVLADLLGGDAATYEARLKATEGADDRRRHRRARPEGEHRRRDRRRPPGRPRGPGRPAHRDRRPEGRDVRGGADRRRRDEHRARRRGVRARIRPGRRPPPLRDDRRHRRGRAGRDRDDPRRRKYGEGRPDPPGDRPAPRKGSDGPVRRRVGDGPRPGRPARRQRLDDLRHRAPRRTPSSPTPRWRSTRCRS